MALNSLEQLYVASLRDLYDAEQQILASLPKMAEKATHPELRRGFEKHQRQTQEQVRRLEQIFESLGEPAKGESCDGMKGLIKEGEKKMKKAEPDTLDAALIGDAQKIEHYEIAGYGTVRTWAEQLGREQDARLLQQTLDEEGETDKLLTEIAERVVNLDALHASAGGRARSAMDREVGLGGAALGGSKGSATGGTARGKPSGTSRPSDRGSTTDF
ncbi:MAG TPA: ferritin-like domain-containing protein [Gemmatimonadaceae bacterium]|nr:ferritin-like domain-containing protein [Gemmatimonadaceae bacterium]